MNQSLKLIVVLPFACAALALACSSEEPSQKTSVESAAPEGDDDDVVSGDDDDDVTNGDDDDDDKDPKKDAGSSKKDAGKDSGPPPGPVALKKSEIQTLFNSRCTPCHVGNASGGLSLANDFTTQTVNVDSTELSTMKRIEPGDKEASYLFHKLAGTHTNVGGSGVRMPKGGAAFSKAELDGIGAYIDSL